jgi:hypothetical protein
VAISAIRPTRRGPVFSPSISQPISAAKTVEVSRSTAAWPTGPRRVASMIPPKDPKATSAPISPRSISGRRGTPSSRARRRVKATSSGMSKAVSRKNHARNVNGSAEDRMPQAS